MQFRAAVKKTFMNNRRQIITVAAAFFVMIALLLTGIFSYYHSEDEVTNTFKTDGMGVKLLEPEWDRVGEDKAKASRPGMTVPKDPYALNSGQTDLYIRLKMTVSLSKFNSEGKSREYAADLNSTPRRMNSVLNAIELKNGSTTTPLFSWSSKTGEISGWELAADCQNPQFYMVNAGTETLSDGSYNQTFYFYYITGEKDGANSKLKTVAPNESTCELFDQLSLPVYKKDYLGVFDQDYNITIEAQAVPAEPGAEATVSAQISRFGES